MCVIANSGISSQSLAQSVSHQERGVCDIESKSLPHRTHSSCSTIPWASSRGNHRISRRHKTSLSRAAATAYLSRTECMLSGVLFQRWIFIKSRKTSGCVSRFPSLAGERLRREMRNSWNLQLPRTVLMSNKTSIWLTYISNSTCRCGVHSIRLAGPPHGTGFDRRRGGPA
jgi:hypothetical protein